jgi:hypothetical protein
MNLVFVVGCARSGTSILGELISSHPDVKYIFEAHSIWEIGGMGENESHRLTEKHAVKQVKTEIIQWFQQQNNDSKILVEKNPRNILRIPYVKEIFPDAKFIHIVRDGRDVACSMVPGCGKDDWRHLKPPSWKEYFRDYSGAIRCAMAWKEILEIGINDLQKNSHLQIKYEDLVSSPGLVAINIFTYLHLDLSPSVLEFCNKIQNGTANSYHAKYQEQWFRNDHQVRIGRWRENLTQDEQDAINEILAPLLLKLGYS